MTCKRKPSFPKYSSFNRQLDSLHQILDTRGMAARAQPEPNTIAQTEPDPIPVEAKEQPHHTPTGIKAFFAYHPNQVIFITALAILASFTLTIFIYNQNLKLQARITELNMPAPTPIPTLEPTPTPQPLTRAYTVETDDWQPTRMDNLQLLLPPEATLTETDTAQYQINNHDPNQATETGPLIRIMPDNGQTLEQQAIIETTDELTSSNQLFGSHQVLVLQSECDPSECNASRYLVLKVADQVIQITEVEYTYPSLGETDLNEAPITLVESPYTNTILSTIEPYDPTALESTPEANLNHDATSNDTATIPTQPDQAPASDN